MWYEKVKDMGREIVEILWWLPQDDGSQWDEYQWFQKELLLSQCDHQLMSDGYVWMPL